MFVIAADDNDRLSLHGAQTGSGARRAGGDRVVDKQDAAQLPHMFKPVLHTSEFFCDRTADIVVDEAGLDDAIGLELVTLRTDKDGLEHVYNVTPFDVCGRDGQCVTFTATHSIDNAGIFKVACRMYPKNELLPHRQDFCYVKWFV